MAPLAPPSTTFGQLEALGLEIEVTCQKCGRRAIIDATQRGLAGQRIAGRRFRCQALDATGRSCGGIGLPTLLETLGRQRTWPRGAAQHASALRWPKPGAK
jgi:hypothetical protein